MNTNNNNSLRIINGRFIDRETRREFRGELIVRKGRIAQIIHGALPAGDGAEQLPVLDAQGALISGGFIDLRADLGVPGDEAAEDLASALSAAAAGGFAAVCPTPNTLPVRDDAAAVSEILTRSRALEGTLVHPIGAATRGLTHEGLSPMGELHDAGALAVSTGENSIPSARMMRRVMTYAHGFDLPLFTAPSDASLQGLCHEGYWSTCLGLPAEPAAAETIIVARDLHLAALTGARLHLQRISSAESVALIRHARARGVDVTCDTSAHHLWFTDADLATYDTAFKVRPPLRGDVDRAALRAGLADGTIDAVISDHRPHRSDQKALEFASARSGASALETTAAAVFALVDQGVLTLAQALSALVDGPQRVLGLSGPGEKMGIQVGAEATLTLFDTNLHWTPGPETFISRSRVSPFAGMTLHGRTRAVLVAGRVIFDTFDDSASKGDP